MARYNEILVGRFARGVQKIFGVKGEVPVASLGGEIQVVHPVFSGAEHRYLEGWDRFGFFVQQAAVAAQAGAIQLRNPAQSGVIAVIEKLLYSNSGGAADAPVVSVGNTAVDLATVFNLNANNLDNRSRPGSSLIGSRQTAVGQPNLTTGIATIQAAALFNWDFIGTDIQEFVVLPGSAVRIISQTNNNALTLSAIWRERFIEESERT